MKSTAIVLAGGKGSRMKSEVRKQYLQIGGKPVLWYSLKTFEECSRIDEVILVCGQGEVEQCSAWFVKEYGFKKISHIVEGGRERYHSVYEGLKVTAQDSDWVFIHDGARPFVDKEILNRMLEALPQCGACVAGMPVKDTIKQSDAQGWVEKTLPRERLWTVQTPQAFSRRLILDAYEELMRREREGSLELRITDDAMVAEEIACAPVRLIEGSYENLKITTPEDLAVAEAILKNRSEK